MEQTIIKYKRIIRRGEKWIQVTGIDYVAEKEELPVQYLNETPNYFAVRELDRVPLLIVNFSDGRQKRYRLDILPKMSKEEFGQLVKTMKAAGERLSKILVDIENKKRRWCGEGSIGI